MRVASRDNVEVPPHPGTILFHPQITNRSIRLPLQQPGDFNIAPLGRCLPARCENLNPTGHWLISDFVGFVEPARGESCPSEKRRGPAAPPHPARTSSRPRIRAGRVLTNFDLVGAVGMKRGSSHSFVPFQPVGDRCEL